MTVLVTGGGTAGHINPGLAVIAELRALHPDLAFVWIGTRDRLEARLVPAAGVPIEFVDVAFLKGRGLGGKLGALLKLPRALWQAWRLVRRHRPDVVVGVGGFASGPVGLAAALARVPTAILEQNARPGLTNRLLGRVARRVFTAFDEAGRWFAARKVALLGNPVRPEVIAAADRPEAAPAAGGVRLLVIGGSQGATSLNRDLPAVLLALRDRLAEGGTALRVRHSAGRGRAEDVRASYACGDADQSWLRVDEYIDDMAGAYLDADLVICRAGASTVAELTAIGMPAVYVPFPAAADNHQERNAQALVDAGAGALVRDRELADPTAAAAFGESLLALVADPARLRAMGRAARTLGRPQAGRDIARAILAMVETPAAARAEVQA
jgi:UDP-N-acetylglucosamine--N-acetylmuramyl-(pentapeptide) pyrophosphoryl-undecaprenol N-acetylglucosamine transferase